MSVVRVRRHPKNRRVGTVPLEALQAVHWAKRSGGIAAGTGGIPFLAAYLYCDQFIAGGVAHSCQHGNGAHWIKVAVVAKDNPAGVMALLVTAADAPGAGPAEQPVREMAEAA